MTEMLASSLSAIPRAGADVSLAPEVMASLMLRALFLAESNLGATSPNPSVGAVVADAVTGEIIASAVTARADGPMPKFLRSATQDRERAAPSCSPRSNLAAISGPRHRARIPLPKPGFRLSFTVLAIPTCVFQAAG